jgi:hydroxyacylglutathione hydrolase
MPSIVTIALGWVNTYLVPGASGYLLVDAGYPGKQDLFFRQLSKHGIWPQEIRLIILTHAHFDHAGSLAAIGQRCGCPVLAHEAEAPLIAKGRRVIPPGTYPVFRLLAALARRHHRIYQQMSAFSPVEADLCVDTGMDLTAWGFDAAIIHTPGHTAGSLTLLTGDGNAFVGDLAFNLCSFGRWRMPPFGDDPKLIRKNWERLLELGARRIYPGHGKPFDARRLRRG